MRGIQLQAAAALLLGIACVHAQTLPGTERLATEGDFADRMVSGIDRFLLRQLAASAGQRDNAWTRDFSSSAAYLRSIAQNRERFREIIGLADERLSFSSPELVDTLRQPALVATGPGYRVLAVRWPVLNGVTAEGLLLEPDQTPVARVVALPDAGWQPEQIAGLDADMPPGNQFARRLAENGCQVLVPVLIDRQPVGRLDERSPRPTNQSHREFVYRMAFELGRHVIGYEVQKILAAVDWFAHSTPRRPIGVAGYGEGGLLALYSAAADTRIDAALVSGYFQSRQEIWKEPVYRNVWGLLTAFGDAELAGLIAPRALVIADSPGPEAGPPPESKELGTGAAPGRIAAPDAEHVRAEYERAKPVFTKLGVSGNLALVSGPDAVSHAALSRFLALVAGKNQAAPAGKIVRKSPTDFDPAARQDRQFRELVAFTQDLLARSPSARAKFWSKADTGSIEAWNRTKQFYRRYLWEEVLGKLPPPSEPLVARTRQLLDEPRWTGYEVVLPLWPDVFAYGVLLVPKDLKPGEKRPVVVCQHGRAGRPMSVIDGPDERTNRVYKRFAAQLADRGFIVYAPQNPYIFEERYRYIQRKANPLKLSLFSFILSQHERTLEWLSGLAFVDPARIGFYGLSYGGKTAVRVPPLLDHYALSICSGDFNEYGGKMAGVDRPDSFMYTIEHEMYEFNLANTFGYAEMANLMAPKPFMVERGHNDGVGLDEWVAHEYAKVRRFYAALGIPERTEIEFFPGVHEIHAEGTFRFLERHLHWPRK